MTTTLPGMNVAALETFLRDTGIDITGKLCVDRIAGGRSNLTYRAHDDTTSWIVRRPPVSGLTPSAHDMAREWTVTRALAGTDVPVATAVAFDADGATLGAPMTVVEFVPGQVVRTRTDLDALTDDDIAANTSELVRVLAALHAVDHHEVGLADFGRPDGFTARQVATWGRQWHRVKTRDLNDIDRLHQALTDAVPAHCAAAIVHGDYRVDNTILTHGEPGTVAALVDWEMSTLGDPLTDIALMCAYRQPMFDTVLGVDAAWTSPRYPDADDLAQHYAVASGRDLAHWSFYRALADFKIAVIAEGIAHRAATSDDTDGTAAAAAHATAEFAAAGLSAFSR